MAMTGTVRHHISVDLHHACTVEVSLVSTTDATEVYLRLAPIASATSRNACHIQTRVLYDVLDEVLHGLRARADHVLVEKGFFRNLARDHNDFTVIRREFYRKRGLVGDSLPGITCLGQPPCRPSVDIELQVYVIIPTSPDAAIITTCPSQREDVSVKLVQIGSARHLFVNNVTGQALNGEPNGFREQSDRMFRFARDTLAAHGVSFRNVLRTWIYLAEIGADYGELNSSRSTFYSEESMNRLPASSGVGGLAHLPSARCALDLHAIVNPEIAKIEVMGSPTINEPCEYGAAFSRGIRMTLSESSHLFVSATPGVDEKGRTAGEGDVRLQMERMLLNVEQLLHGQGAAWSDTAYAVTYLKSPEYLDLYERVCAEQGLDHVPHSIVCAGICRPDLVGEMEAVAVIPSA